MRYWDSSAVVSLCADQAWSEPAHALLGEDRAVATSWLTVVECRSAFARLRREGILDESGEERARALAVRLQEHSVEVVLTALVREGAGRLIRVHPLRAMDALQLSSALVWADGRPDGEFVCFDTRLRQAARLEGFRVLPADLAPETDGPPAHP